MKNNEENKVKQVPMQEASLDIWDKKYRLKDMDENPIDGNIEDTYQRVAKSLSDLEETPELKTYWYSKFLAAMRSGAIPAGRITSNAGANEYKPATSLINCTVSDSIFDSMDNIMTRAHQAAMTLRAGCGIGYSFDTLRPKGAFVAGAGASTSGPISFMDIFDSVCFTVASAGGRRGAQMATFDIGHPDVMDFIRAKREDGRLRQFNLSLLITDEFIEAVKNNAMWPLSFPLSKKEVKRFDLNDASQVVWREWPIKDGYTVREDGKVACRIYDKINACNLWDMIMSSTYDFAEPGFILIDKVNEMNNNWWCENIRATNPCVTADTWVHTSDGPRQVSDLIGKQFNAIVDGAAHKSGSDGFFQTSVKKVFMLKTVEGYTLRLTEDHRIKVLPVTKNDRSKAEWVEAKDIRNGDRLLLNIHTDNKDWKGFGGTWDEGFIKGSSHQGKISSDIEKKSSDFQRGFLCGLFNVNCVELDQPHQDLALCFYLSDDSSLSSVQRMLLRFGITSRIQQSQAISPKVKNDSRELIILGNNLISLSSKVNDIKSVKEDADFIATFSELTPDGEEDVYDVQVPGINTFDANGFHAHNCGEQPLPPNGACLLGSINLTKFVKEPFTQSASFDWDAYEETVRVFTRMLDNVVEVNGLPLKEQVDEIFEKRRHGMGFLGLGSAMTMLRMPYGSKQSIEFTENVSKKLAMVGWEEALKLAKEKGPAPIMNKMFEVTKEMLSKRPEMAADGYSVGDKVKGSVLHAKYSRYMQRIASENQSLVDELAEVGARFTHHSSIAPTGTISLSLANNASNGIEPSFAHSYSRNVIRPGRKAKEKIDVYSYELLSYKTLVNPEASPFAEDDKNKLPDYFISADQVTPKQHVDIQAASQKWIDSSISKTANVPTDYPYEDFKDIYMYAYEQGLKGCTTFRFNPEAFQGVLVKNSDLENTTYTFNLEDGSTVSLKGGDLVEYDGQTHTAANLFDALKEGYYGKF